MYFTQELNIPGKQLSHSKRVGRSVGTQHRPIMIPTAGHIGSNLLFQNDTARGFIVSSHAVTPLY